MTVTEINYTLLPPKFAAIPYAKYTVSQDLRSLIVLTLWHQLKVQSLIISFRSSYRWGS